MAGQNFVLGILMIVVGIPVICGTLISLIHGPKDKKGRRNKKEAEKHEKNQEILEEIYYGLRDLGKRVSNLETILDEKNRGGDYE